MLTKYKLAFARRLRLPAKGRGFQKNFRTLHKYREETVDKTLQVCYNSYASGGSAVRRVPDILNKEGRSRTVREPTQHEDFCPTARFAVGVSDARVPVCGVRSEDQ